MKIVEYGKSHRNGKRMYVVLSDGRTFHFGLDGGSTYIDHKSKIKRDAYWARHMGNPIEAYRIRKFIPSAALFSAYILWGDSTSIKANINSLNRHL